jgi:Domain of unknown function (DUF4326)
VINGFITGFSLRVERCEGKCYPSAVGEVYCYHRNPPQKSRQRVDFGAYIADFGDIVIPCRNMSLRYFRAVYGHEQAVALYRRDVEALSEIEREAWLAPLRQASALMCWCPLDEPCHADVLIEYLDKPAE